MSSYNLIRDSEKRSVKAPSKYAYVDVMAYAFSVAADLDLDDPKAYSEAISSKDRNKWIEVMNDEIQSFCRNKTWRLVERSSNQKIVDCKWLFKRKQEHIEKDSVIFNARLVARSFT